MDVKVCANCKDKFVFSHMHYRPKVKYEAKEGELFTTVYCSDACFELIPKDKKAPCGCEMRRLVMTEGRLGGDKMACLLHMTVFEAEAV